MKTKNGPSKFPGQAYTLSEREIETASLMLGVLSEPSEHGEYLWPYGRRIGTPIPPATVARKIGAIQSAEAAGMSPLVYLAMRPSNVQINSRSYRRAEMPSVKGPGEIWAMDFIADALADGRRIRILTIIVASTEECVHIEIDFTLTGVQVAHVLEQVRQRGRLPKLIQADHERAFVENALYAWAQQHNVKLQFRTPDRRMGEVDNLSFYSRLCKECLNQHAFRSLDDARKRIETWRTDYNSDRA